MDGRLQSLELLLTGRRLIEGMGEGPCRGHNACRIIGVPLFQRTVFYEWCEAEGLFLQPISPFWHEFPLAGCVDLAVLRERLRKAIANNERLPFDCIHIPELTHAAA